MVCVDLNLDFFEMLFPNRFYLSNVRYISPVKAFKAKLIIALESCTY